LTLVILFQDLKTMLELAGAVNGRVDLASFITVITTVTSDGD
jgi:hypothetical protein